MISYSRNSLSMNATYTTPFFQLDNDPELATILNHAYASSPIVRQALWQSFEYYQHVLWDQQRLLTQNKTLWTLQEESQSLLDLQNKTLARIDSDLAHITKFNETLQLHPSPSHENDYTWSLATHKMENVLLGAKGLLEDETTFKAIVQGYFPECYPYQPPFPVILGEQDSPYGNSQVTYLSAAMLEVNLSLQPEPSIHNILTEQDNLWIDEAAIAHITPIAQDITLDQDFIHDFSFYFSDPFTPQGLIFVHSGYAFGGQRFETRYADGKEWGPEDCSSWIAKIVESDFPFSTIDQLYTYRMSLPEENRGYVDPDWLQSPDSQILEYLTPVTIHNPIEDIQPGQVFTFRNFAEGENHDISGGIGGHTTLVLGVRENGNVVSLGYARNMPEIEGFGIQEFQWNSSANRETMYFEIKNEKAILQTEDIFSQQDLISDQLFEPVPFHLAPQQLEFTLETPQLI